MDYATASDPLLQIARSSAWVITAVTLGLIGVIALMRLTLDRRHRREQQLRARWTPVFLCALEGLPYATPRLGRGDARLVLALWVNFVESIRGEAVDRLVQAAQSLDLGRIARQLLKRRSVRQRLIAVVALGRLQQQEAADDLDDLVDHDNTLLSLMAARSLTQLDGRRGLGRLLFELGRREDWPLQKVAALLADLPEGWLAQPLLEMLRRATPAQVPRLLGLLRLTQFTDSWTLLEHFLTVDQSPEVLAAALRVARDPRSLPKIRALTTHPSWVVRAQAAQALGHVGEGQDLLRLRALLSDPEWWVRYRAASALADSPGVSLARLQALVGHLSDHFAADILRQVLAERRGAAV